MKKWKTVFAVSGVTLALSAICGVAHLRESSHRGGISPQLDKAAFAQKTQKLQMPFIANKGQVDEQVEFYAKTFGGTVFVTKDGEIVYALPNNRSDVETQCLVSLMHSPKGIRDKVGMLHDYHVSDIMHPASWIVDHDKSAIQNQKSGVALREEFVGAMVKTIQGEDPSITKVNYFKGSDPSKWKTNVSTYDAVSLGDVYDGIELKLKAYGNNVEKLFCVKPGADPEQIKISLSGIQPHETPMIEEKQPPESPFIKGDLTESPLEKGARGLWVNEEGQLVAETELGPVKFTKPIAYQEIDGKRVEVAVEYRIQGSDVGWVKRSAPNKNDFNGLNRWNDFDGFASLNPSYPLCGDFCWVPYLNPTYPNLKLKTQNSKLTYGFKVASYDRTKPLIIDPLLASTYLGGSGEDGHGYSLAFDTSGNVYVTGGTKSTDFPTTIGAYDTSYYNGGDVFVSKLDSGLTSLLASTYLGGSSTDEEGYFLTLDTSGHVYVMGMTYSTDFPTTIGAYDTSYNGDDGGDSDGDVFLSKLDSGLTSLLASTYLGGSSGDQGGFLTLDTNGNVYVTGSSESSDFPTTIGAYDTSYNDDSGSDGDVFISKLDSGLTSLLASTYLGGSGEDEGTSLIFDTNGNVYVTGTPGSTDFPTTSGAYDTSYNGGDSGGDGNGDAFISKLDSGLTSLLASTFLGGADWEYGSSLALDTSGDIYITGQTGSTDFPTTIGAYDTSYNGGDGDVFVSKLDSGLTSLLASTFLGGSGGEAGLSLTLDTNGNIYVTGGTDSKKFPTTIGAYDTSYNGGDFDVFVSKLDSGLTSLLASTFLGGSGGDVSLSLALDTNGNVYVMGITDSKKFPTTNGAYDTSYNGGDFDVFVSKLDGALSAECDGKAKTVETDTGDFELLREENKVVTLTVTDAGGCPVANKKVSAKINSAGKKRISISPSSETTDENGAAAFTITAKKKTGNAKVTFKSGGIKKKITVNVVSE